MKTLSFTQPFRDLRLAFATDIAIDLGTSNTRIYSPGHGLVLNEPSVVGIDNRTNQILIAGGDAKKAIGREPQSVRIVGPVKEGVIGDFDASQQMISYFIRQALGRSRFLNPRVMICAAGELTPVERRAVEDVTYRAGAKRVEVVEAPIAAASGAGYEANSACTFMVVDIGGGTTDVAVMSCGGAVEVTSLRVGGNRMDQAIADFLRYKRGVEIGSLTAEAVKLEIGSVEPQARAREMEVRGRSAATGMPETVTITGDEVRAAIEPVVVEIIRAVRYTMEELPPEVSADLLDSGIVLSGGVSQLAGLKERLTREVGLEVRLAPEPQCTVALGAGRLLQRGANTRKLQVPTEQTNETYTPARAA
jgi:rod shape-determining protein MreB and related proteins